MTVLPFVYAILSLLELMRVDSPRFVAGLHGKRAAFVYDIAADGRRADAGGCDSLCSCRVGGVRSRSATASAMRNRCAGPGATYFMEAPVRSTPR